jgi:hypothetical protein
MKPHLYHIRPRVGPFTPGAFVFVVALFFALGLALGLLIGGVLL